jgi:hypothetical protein
MVHYAPRIQLLPLTHSRENKHKSRHTLTVIQSRHVTRQREHQNVQR